MSESLKKEGRKSPKGRIWQQIGEVLRFDARRSVKRIGILVVLNAVASCLVAFTYKTVNLPAEAPYYAMPCLILLNQFLLPLTAVVLGNSIIVEDFEKKTSNLLFPKVSRGRLLFSRYISRLAGGSLAIGAYYIMLVIATTTKYETVPGTFWGSFGWTVAYLHLHLSFMTLLSAILNRVATSIVAGVFLLNWFFIFLPHSPIAQHDYLEPLWLLPYIGNIFYEWLNMFDPRFRKYYGSSGEWLTPTPENATLFITLYSLAFLVLAVLLYRQKDVKN